MGLFGNGSLRAHTDDRGSLTLPWGDGGVGVACVVGISVRGDANLNSAWSDLAPIVRTRVETGASAFEMLDFAPLVRDRGELLAPPAVARILRPLRGVPRVRVTFAAGACVRRETGAGFELVAPDGTLLCARGSLAPHALRGEEFPLAATELLLASRGELGGPFAAPAAELVPELLLRTEAAWDTWRLGLRLPPRAGAEVQRAALRIAIGAERVSGAFPECEDVGALVAALDLLGCRAELRAFAGADAAAQLHANSRLLPADAVPGARAARLAEVLAVPPTWGRAAEALAAWGLARAARGVAVECADRDLEALALRTLRAARAFVELRCFDERSGLLKAAPDDPLLDWRTLRAVTNGFFAARDPRARALTLALAGLLAHDLGAPPQARAESAHALALVGEWQAARDALLALDRERSCHGEFGAAVAFVRASFAGSND